MTLKQLLNKAGRANQKHRQAQDTVEQMEREREETLEVALLHIKTVGDAVAVFGLSKNSLTETRAWEKAVTLLGTTGKALADYELLKQLRYHHRTSRYATYREEYERKGRLIESSATAGDYDRLWESDPCKYQTKLQDRFEKLVRDASTLEALAELHAKYQSLIKNEDIEGTLTWKRLRLFDLEAEKCQNLHSLNRLSKKFWPDGVPDSISSSYERTLQENAERFK